MKLNKNLTNGIFILLIAFTIMSCKNETEKIPADECVVMKQAQQQLTDNLKMYETVWDDVINKREIDKINADNFDQNITLISSPENIVGIEAFKAYYQNYLTGFSDVTFSIIDVFGQGDKIVKHWNFKGTHTGEFFGIAPTGKTVNIEGVTLVIMKNGKILQEQDFMDNLSFYQQLGLIPLE